MEQLSESILTGMPRSRFAPLPAEVLVLVFTELLGPDGSSSLLTSVVLVCKEWKVSCSCCIYV
jgi:hypothetical protein